MTLDGERIVLYDVQEDREEANNRAAEHPQVVAEMREQLEAWIETLPEGPNPECFSEAREQ